MLGLRIPWPFQTASGLVAFPGAGRRAPSHRVRRLLAAQHLPVPPVKGRDDGRELLPCLRGAVMGSAGEAAAGSGYPRSGWAEPWMMLTVLTALKDQGLGFAAVPFPPG